MGLIGFDFYRIVLGIVSGSIGFVVPFRLSMLDSQPVKSNMGSVPNDFDGFRHFQKSCHGFLARYLLCVRAGRPKIRFVGPFGRNRKVAPRKVEQIRDGITS